MTMERWHKILLLTTVYVSFLLSGTLIFQALEKGEEENLRVQIRNNLVTFLVNNTCVDESELIFIVNEVVNAYSNGLRFEENNITSFGKHLWDFSNSLFFATTVITTIGYGNMTPATYEGKIFCMFFAIVGIPLTGIFASLMGNHLEKHWRDIINKLNKSLHCIKNIKFRRSLTTLMVALSLYGLIVCVPALIVNEIEGWGWFISHYYALISISTIGFGDYVAGNGSNMSDTARVFYKLALVTYFIFGFVILTLIFKMSQQIHDRQVRKVRKFTNSVRGRLRRTSLFPSQSSSTVTTPRPSIIAIKSSNGDIHKESNGKVKHPTPVKRKSPTYHVNGHIKKQFSFGRARKVNRRRSVQSQELILNLSTNSSYFDNSTKDLSTVVSKEDIASLNGSDDVFTLPKQNNVDGHPKVLFKSSKSLHDFREMICTPSESVAISMDSGKTSNMVISDGWKTL